MIGFQLPTNWLVEQDKVTKYLLNTSHPQGGGKAKFFMAFGFDPAQPVVLADALAHHVFTNLPGRHVPQKFGPSRLVFEGPMETPDGRIAEVRTVWEITMDDQARFLTAVPLTRRSRFSDREG
ncbi:MAG: hypothetical protein K2Y56_24050 [Methylobacterium sp.]|uniref:DUF6883 domain-containing protein n=1 Tax=Methylobacterium sp. TaxID=409 RepID=UPI0025D3E52A|nr:DUF6883 domain-containing protein [Methylobacterium sp.]MBX9934551.1 hypothetical protein [Methylobacterium sp.]